VFGVIVVAVGWERVGWETQKGCPAPYPIPSALKSGLLDGCYDAAKIALKIHGPLAEVACGQGCQTGIAHCNVRIIGYN
jgi:hypothetical protein